MRYKIVRNIFLTTLILTPNKLLQSKTSSTLIQSRIRMLSLALKKATK